MSTIRRATHDDINPWFQLARATAQDRSITFEARGVLIYLLSKPGDWKVQVSDLEQECGKTRVYRILKELIAAHYMQKQFIRSEGKVRGIEYLVSEMPTLFPENLKTENQQLTVTGNSDQVIVTDSDSENLHLAEKSAAPDETPSYIVVQPKLPRRRSWTLETVALECFGLQRDQITHENNSGHIAIIVNGSHKGNGEMGILQYAYKVPRVNKETITEEMDLALSQELILMFSWWRKTKPGLDVPRASYKIWKALVDYRATKQPAPAAADPVPSQQYPLVSTMGRVITGPPAMTMQSRYTTLNNKEPDRDH